MNLRTLLNRSRFVGCVNPRTVVREKKLSLFCAETEEGACLMMEREGVTTPLTECELPPHLLERVRFWNAWCSSGFNGESEVVPSVFGLEAYAVSIGVEVLRCFPDCAVDWCGLPLHDDVALLDALEKNRSLPCPPHEAVLNRYAARLMRGDCPDELPPDGVAARNVFDWCLERLELVPLTDADDFFDVIHVGEDDIGPQGLVKHHLELTHLSYMESDGGAYSWGELCWHYSPILHPLLLSAVAVDWARVLKRPVCTHRLYLAGEDVLQLCNN